MFTKSLSHQVGVRARSHAVLLCLHLDRDGSTLDRMETWAVRRCDVVITGTRVNEDLMVSEFGGSEQREKFITIHNGFERKCLTGLLVKALENA